MAKPDAQEVLLDCLCFLDRAKDELENIQAAVQERPEMLCSDGKLRWRLKDILRAAEFAKRRISDE